jgi:hypothetical protein
LKPLKWRTSPRPSQAVCSRCNSVTNIPIQIVHHKAKDKKRNSPRTNASFSTPVCLHEKYLWNVHLQLDVECNK